MNIGTEAWLQLDMLARLVVAAIFGAAIGIEREVHDHPAGTRTHLLVSLGAAVFTVISAYGFGGAALQGAVVDPTRIAAQIVTGIGFLGAGAIIHYGTSVRGLTTAASLWVTASVGMACGAGMYVVGVAATVFVAISLGPLHALAERLRPRGGRSAQFRLELDDLAALGSVSALLGRRAVEMGGIESRRLRKGRYAVDLDVVIPVGDAASAIAADLGRLPSVEVTEVDDGSA